jgi:3-hydroxyisobutyrate dehydrogenase-like beta-hydroxyacid dehydrogenase
MITMLADDSALEAVTQAESGFLNSLPEGATHVSCSTISVAAAKRLKEAHAARGQRLVSAPVFGRPEAAESAKLFVVAAGTEQALDRCAPIFAAIGQKTFVVGNDPEMANVVKLSGNFLIANVIESLGEAVALVRKYGIDAQQYMGILTSTLFSAPVYQTYGGKIARSEYEPVGFRMKLGLKDVRLALDAADAAAVPMPVASVIRDHMISALAQGMENADWSALAKLLARNAGLDAA